jgi:predicted nucleotidyltransferase
LGGGVDAGAGGGVMKKSNPKKSRDEIEKTLKRLKPTLRRRWKVERIGIFGSYARGEHRKRSDVDILVDFSEPLGWEFFDLKEYLQEKLGMKVDLATEGALRVEYKEQVLREVIFA